MDLVPTIANAEDVARLFSLEQAGHLPAGYTKQSIEGTVAYLDRILWLKAKYSVLSYPGPTIVVAEAVP